MNFLQDLNKSQLDAVSYNDGPSLVIAGAGSGKTRVLTYKVAYLLANGMHPASILALTFTNKAANEMRERIADLVGYDVARYLWMGTFHSVFSRILRNEAELIGYTHDYTIYDSADSKSLIKDIIKSFNLDEKIYRPGNIHTRISHAKNNLFTPEAYYANSELQKNDMMSRVPRTAEIYALYAKRCKQANAMDFDDLLLQTNVLFRDHPQILDKYRRLFNFILVDEYQDTNFSQYLIVKNLAEFHRRICVVGDDAQSIYSFRGANIDNILKFQQTYRDSKLFKLEQNYRSTQTIVNAANSLIDKNAEQIRKKVFSEKERGEPIEIRTVMTDFEEAYAVANKIVELRKREKFNYNEIAVLYRTNSQSRVMEEAFRKHNIPYRIYGGLSFYQRKEIRDVIAYLRLIVNPHDEEALKRIINYPARGIGQVTLQKLTETATLHDVSLWTILTDVLGYNLNVNAGTAAKLVKFREMIEGFSALLTTMDAFELAQHVVKVTGVIADAMHDRSAESLSRIDNVQELLNAIHEFTERKRVEEEFSVVLLNDFLAEVSLQTDQDTDDESEYKVTMMTVHSAKGLEFRSVFIVGMEEQLFPSPYVETPREMEEERRLFYVAITRAEEYCFISHAKSRFRNGKTNFANPSRFLRDIDDAYVRYYEETSYQQGGFFEQNSYDDIPRNRFRQELFRSGNTTASTKSPAPSSGRNLRKITKTVDEVTPLEKADLPVGAFVQHSSFGVGKILETILENGNEKAKIDFGEKGVKSLLLKFAKLEILK